MNSRPQNFFAHLVAGALAATLVVTTPAAADPNYQTALRRAQWLLNGTIPTDDQYTVGTSSDASYKTTVRSFIDGPNFYDAAMRYHELIFGTGLDPTYLSELQASDIDNKENKIAQITCTQGGAPDYRYECYWSGQTQGSADGSCPQAWEQAVSAFWYPGVVAWACPSVVNACGADLSRCYIQYSDPVAAQNAELGATEIFDTQYAVTNSLSRQAAGLATAVAVSNYPYTKILQSGLSAVDGAIAHFYHLNNQFDPSKLNGPNGLATIIDQMSLTNSHYVLVNTGNDPLQAGVLSTYGWLRRYEINRDRANNLYSRFLCHEFTSMLPRVFPADPGNLRVTPGCMGCHATLDPLADFFAEWGEGGNLYSGAQGTVPTYFDNQNGAGLAALGNIITNDDAFSSCTVQNVWQWLMGRGFYRDEANLRAALTNYFITTNYSFKELVYAVATHPGFIEGTRTDGTVGDPLDSPPLGQPPGGDPNAPCPASVDFTNDIVPQLGQCSACHYPGVQGRQDLSTSAEWQTWGSQAVSMMASGEMPPGQSGPPLIGPVWNLKESVRCWLAEQPQ